MRDESTNEKSGQSHLNWWRAQNITVRVCVCVAVYLLSSVKHFEINLFVRVCL